MPQCPTWSKERLTSLKVLGSFYSGVWKLLVLHLNHITLSSHRVIYEAQGTRKSVVFLIYDRNSVRILMFIVHIHNNQYTRSNIFICRIEAFRYLDIFQPSLVSLVTSLVTLVQLLSSSYSYLWKVTIVNITFKLKDKLSSIISVGRLIKNVNTFSFNAEKPTRNFQ